MRSVEIANGEIYHVFNRGTDKRNIFLKKVDYERFLVDLILFNTESTPLSNSSRYDVSSASLKIPEDPLVKIHAFVILPNHFHLILEQVAEKGISRFMHRLEMGYSQYFNRFYKRSGNLFQGTYKAVIIDRDAYLSYLPLYVHINPLNLLPDEAGWKENGVKDKKLAIDFLKKYPWSSLQSYLNIREQPFVEKGLFGQIYASPADWEKELVQWLTKDNVSHLVAHIV